MSICVYLWIHSVSHRRPTPLVNSGYISKNDTFLDNYSVAYPIFHREKIDTLLRNYVNHQVDDFLRTHDSMQSLDVGLIINYTILHYDARTLSIMFHETEHMASRGEVRTQTIVTYDLQKNSQLKLTDITKDKPLAAFLLRRILHDYFQHLTTESLTPDELTQLANIKLEDMGQFVLDDDALILYLDPREPTSQQSNVTVSINKQLLSGVLDDAFVEASPSQTQRTIESSTYAIDSLPAHELITDLSAKMLALTFDDGPGVLTQQLLDVLNAYSAHATFFVIGRQVPTYADAVRREIAEGNEVGNHTWNHPKLTGLTPSELERQIDDTQRVIKNATGGYTPVLMRPPQGAVNSLVSSFIHSRGMQVQLWNVDTLDWLDRDAQVVYERIMAGAGDGRVILLHDIHPTSVAAATRAIPELISQGYELVTVSELNRYRP